MKRHIQTKNGFMLLEMLDALFIFSIVAIVIFGVFDAGDHLWTITEANAYGSAEMRRILSEMERDIRAGKDFDFNVDYTYDSGSSTSVQFNLGDDQAIKYYATEEGVPDTSNGTFWIARDIKDPDTNITISTQFIAPVLAGITFAPSDTVTPNKSTSVVVSFNIYKVTERGKEFTFPGRYRIAMRNANLEE